MKSNSPTLLGALLVASSLAQAQVIYTQDFNGGSGGGSNTPVSGWTIASTGDFFGQPFGGLENFNITGGAGNSSLQLYMQVANDFFGATTAPVATADTGVAYVANTAYTLNFDFTGKNDPNQWYRDATFTYQIWAGAPTGGGLQLGSGSVTDSDEQNTITPLSLTSLANAGGSGNLFLVFSSTSPTGTGSPDGFRQAIIDNISVSISAPIPEPSSFAALSGLALLGYASLARRRRAS
jgi:hypothetical protein